MLESPNVTSTSQTNQESLHLQQVNASTINQNADVSHNSFQYCVSNGSVQSAPTSGFMPLHALNSIASFSNPQQSIASTYAGSFSPIPVAASPGNASQPNNMQTNMILTSQNTFTGQNSFSPALMSNTSGNFSSLPSQPLQRQPYHQQVTSNQNYRPSLGTVIHDYSHIRTAIEGPPSPKHNGVAQSFPQYNSSAAPRYPYGVYTNNNATITQPANNSIHSMNEKMVSLTMELEKERNGKVMLQQRVIELQKQMHAQILIEKSYEELSVKYKSLLSKAQQMTLVIERYQSLLKHVEQEKRMMMAENSSLKAHENAAHDKTMLYNILMERSKKLEEEKSSLVLENETHQRQYEKCVDEISQQVVQALMTQKALQEQCVQLQERVIELEREKKDFLDGNKNRQTSSDSRLGSSKLPRRAASPSADSVKSMPAQHNCWKKSSFSSLDIQHLGRDGIPEGSAVGGQSSVKSVCVETEFPAGNGSPKIKRRSIDRHPSGGSLDHTTHSKLIHGSEQVRCVRSMSAEALRDMRINPAPLINSAPCKHAEPHKSLPSVQYRDKTFSVQYRERRSHDTPDNENRNNAGESEESDDPFADDADDILSKHQSLIVGSTEDLFSQINGESPHLYKSTITEEEGSPYNQTFNQSIDSGSDRSTPPPLPPKQYKGSRRPYKPLPAAPPDSDSESDKERREDSEGQTTNTDSESIKQEITLLTSKISNVTSK